MSVVEEKSVGIVGGGLVGSLAALMLAQKGYHVKLFERRPDIRSETQIEGHRSINLALSVRGISALKMVGLDDEVLKTVIPMKARMIHHLNTAKESTPQPYGTFGECINSVDRKLLNRKLLDAAESLPYVELFFNCGLESINPENGTIEVLEKEKGTKKTYTFDYVLGCDGAFSATRLELMRRQPYHNALIALNIFRIDFEQRYIKHGYKELCILPDKEGKARIPVNYLHIWPRQKFMLIALPNQDNSFTATLFYPYDELVEIKTKQQVLELFETNFSDALDLIGADNLVNDFFENPSSPLVTIKLNKYNYKDRVLMLGDSIHAMVPFYGQGMNAGFEDVEVLSKLIEEFGGDLGEAIKAFTQRRRPDAHAICDLALYNYTEMSTLVLSRKYLAKKWLYSWLHWMAPQTFVPLYTMVSFSKTPYSKAIEKRDKQDALVATIGSGVVLGGLITLGFKLLRPRNT